MKASHLSYGFLLSFLLTAFFLQWASPPFTTPVWLAAFFVTVLLVALCAVRQLRLLIAPTAAAALGMFVAMIAISMHAHVSLPTDIENATDGKKHALHGFIVADPDKRPMQTKYTVAVDTMRDEHGEWQPVTGRVLVTDRQGWPEHAYLDEVHVSGKLERPGKIEDFSYDNYLRMHDIYAVIYVANVTTIAPQSYPTGFLGYRTIFAGLLRLREGFESQIARVYPEPHASFLAGLLTGSRRGIPDALTEQFRISGLSHIIAISGYNITIIIALLSGLLFFVPFRLRFPVLSVGIIAFTVLVGASASVVRAAIMGILGLLAIQLGRQAQIRLSILWTAFLMVLWNPTLLWFDAGFQLSFLAVIGLSELSPWLTRVFHRVPDTLGIRTSLIATVAAQIATLPLLILLFKRVSIISPIANLLVAPLIPLAMLTGFVGTVLSFVWFPLGQLVAYAGWGLLELIILIAKLCAAIPYASVGM